jgi:ATP-dependent DNA helicase PIF1
VIFIIVGCNGTTVHHWAGMRDNRYSNIQLLNLLTNDITFKSAKENIQNTETLIIDEISMLSADVFSQLEFVCRKIRKSERVFGGLQVIVCGDFLQLKPVPNPYYNDPGDYAFMCVAWNRSISHVVVLNDIMRQHDPDLIKAIHELAVGELSPESIQFLDNLSRPLPPGPDPVFLFSRNFDVEMTNYDFLDLLEEPAHVYKSADTGEPKSRKKFAAPKCIVLKKNCRVILLTNINSKLVNGTQGKVVACGDDFCMVDFDDVGLYKVKPYVFSIYSRELKVDLATRKQLPLKLAYAITMHRSQGTSLNRMVVDAEHTYKSGQLATAIGRATCKEGLQLLHFCPHNVPTQSHIVMEFLDECRNHTLVLRDDFSCCHNYKFADEEQVDLPLGNNPFLVQPEVDNFDICSDFDNDEVDKGEDDDDDNDEDAALLESLIRERASQCEDICFDFDAFRKSVQTEFEDQETKEQRSLADKDSDLNVENLKFFLVNLWKLFDDNFKSLEKKGYGKLEHKDFYDFMIKCDRYQNNYDDDLQNLFGHQADDKDKRLAHKYILRLTHRFLSYKETTSKGDTANTNSTSPVVAAEPSAESLAAIRYLSGMCVAKCRYKQCNIALNNVHNIKEREKVLDARKRVKLLETHIVPQGKIQQTTKLPATLDMIIRKQNLRQGLTHVSDEVFDFFCSLDKLLAPVLTFNTLKFKRGDLFVMAEESVLKNEAIFLEWKSLFGLPGEEDSFLFDLMALTITPYIHVRCNQFRKDMIDKLRDTKTLEIRKAVWNRKRKGKATSGIPCKKVNSKLTMKVILEDKSTDFQVSHERLKSLCVSEKSHLSSFGKEDLKILCQAYNVVYNSRWKKDDLIKGVADKIMISDSVVNPGVWQGQRVQDNDREYHSENSREGEDEEEYSCPKCNTTSDTNDSTWVGCDNDACGLYVCRKCAALENEEDYQQALKTFWSCPVCS